MTLPPILSEEPWGSYQQGGTFSTISITKNRKNTIDLWITQNFSYNTTKY